MRRSLWALAVLTVVVGSVATVAAQATPDGDSSWRLWSQHRNESGLWWRPEAGPFSLADCRASLKAAAGRPKVGATKWYDITPANLQQAFGRPTPAGLGTWIACWPAGFDFDRDLVDQ